MRTITYTDNEKDVFFIVHISTAYREVIPRRANEGYQRQLPLIFGGVIVFKMSEIVR
jgi:hypothetical protein